MTPRAATRQLLLKGTIYLGAVALYVAVTVGVASWAGELTPLTEVARQQVRAPLLYGRAYRDNYFAFKLVSVRERRPEVLVVGSSRTMEFREGLVNRRPSMFYNAGGSSQSLPEVRRFVDMVSATTKPKIMILGLDQWWFNPRHSRGPSAVRVQEQIDEESAVASARVLNVGRFVVRDLVFGKIPPHALLMRRDPVYGIRALGMSAIVNGNGFRNDGSYQYGHLLMQRSLTEERLRAGYDRLGADKDHFSSGAHVDASSVTQIDELLERCRRDGTFVFGFSPPYAPSIYARMKAGGRHGYLADMATTLRAVFDKHGFVYLDFSDAAAAGGTDDDMIDGFHGSELVYLRIYLAMLEARPDILRAYSDDEALRRLARATAVGRFEVFGSHRNETASGRDDRSSRG